MTSQKTKKQKPLTDIFKIPEIPENPGLEPEEWDYKYSTIDDIDPSNQRKRDEERVDQQRTIEQMYAPAKKRLDRLIKYTTNFFKNGYKELGPVAKKIKIRRIDYRIHKIMTEANLYGPRADEIRNDYRSKVVNLEKKATGIAALFNSLRR